MLINWIISHHFFAFLDTIVLVKNNLGVSKVVNGEKLNSSVIINLFIIKQSD